jgi:hypothetical protein
MVSYTSLVWLAKGRLTPGRTANACRPEPGKWGRTDKLTEVVDAHTYSSREQQHTNSQQADALSPAERIARLRTGKQGIYSYLL